MTHRPLNSAQTVLVTVAVFFSLMAYHLTTAASPQQYIGFSEVRWQESPGCFAGGAYSAVPHRVGSIARGTVEGREHRSLCQ